MMIGTTLGHYRIVEKIGEGGMGVVYRAHDERLDRDVAIKVLPDAVAEDPDRVGRFEREARAVARLDHPNILAIHDFGTEGSVTYSVTEVLEGETLREHFESVSLGWRKAAEVGAFIALSRQRHKLIHKLMTTDARYDKVILIARHLERIEQARMAAA